MTNKIGNKTDSEAFRERELLNCNFIKTVLMLMVVVYHCVLYWKGNWFIGTPEFSAPALSVLAQWLNTFHIYAFALVSGYLFRYLKYEKGKYGEFLPFLKNKCNRLLVPYVFVCLVWAIPFAVYFFQYSTLEVAVKFLLGTSPSQLWFLLMLFGVFMIFYPLANFFEKHFAGGVLLALAFYAFGFIGRSLLPNVFQISTACLYIPFFWLGFAVRKYGSRWLRKIPGIAWVVADLALFALDRYFSVFDGVIFNLLKMGISFLLHIVGALMAFVVLQKIADRVRWQESKVFGMLCKKSMAVYLFHQQVIYVCISLLNGIVNPYVHAGINFIGAMGISLCLSAVLMKFPRTRGLLGEK